MRLYVCMCQVRARDGQIIWSGVAASSAKPVQRKCGGTNVQTNTVLLQCVANGKRGIRPALFVSIINTVCCRLSFDKLILATISWCCQSHLPTDADNFLHDFCNRLLALKMAGCHAIYKGPVVSRSSAFSTPMYLRRKTTTVCALHVTCLLTRSTRNLATRGPITTAAESVYNLSRFNWRQQGQNYTFPFTPWWKVCGGVTRTGLGLCPLIMSQ